MQSVHAPRGFRAGIKIRCCVAMCAATIGLMPCFAFAASLPDQQSAQPLPSSISTSIPDDAELISPEYAVLPSGELVDIVTGAQVSDSALVGTEDTPADPLTRTDGASFTPMSVGEARQSSGAELLALPNGGYGAYWGSAHGNPAFYMGNGTVFAYQAKGVIDVSTFQKKIDWQAVKNAGVEGAIIRIGYGDGNADDWAKRNISECKRLGIPFGVYLYSYADNDTITGTDEGSWVLNLLKTYGVAPSDLSYPVYYDLEHWSWTGHTPPTDPGVYEEIVRDWCSVLQKAGYTNLGVYSYRNYLYGPLNSSYIHSKTSWVAQYSSELTFNDFGSSFRGWQYSSSATIAGIEGKIDVNAFGDSAPVFPEYNGTSLSSLGTKVTDIAEGDYYIQSALGDRVIDIDNASLANGAKALIWPSTKAENQLFHIKPLGGGEYSIVSVHSGKSLDVYDASTANGAAIIQFTSTGSANQRWSLYRNSAGNVLIASVNALSKNKVLDLENGNSAPGTPLMLWAANGGTNQQFKLIRKQDEGKPSAYTVAFDSNGGSSVASQSVATGSKASKPADPTRRGYAFLGWYTARDGGSKYDFSHTVSANMRLYAHWQPITGWILEDGAYRWYENGVRSEEKNKEIYDSKTKAWYFLDSNSAMVRGRVQWVPADGGKWCYYDADGKRVNGEKYLSYDATHTGWYYFDTKTGAMVHGVKWLPSSGGKWVYYDIHTGQMAHGERYLDYDAAHTGWYLFDAYSGAMVHGDVYLPANGGKWVRYDRNTGIMVKGLQRQDGSWYYFDPITGAMAHGRTWVPEWNAWHMFDAVTGRG